MYSEAWARDVLAHYRRLCTRAQQMDGVICQILIAQGFSNCRPEALTAVLIASIQKKRPQRLWTLYKRLNKRTPLDRILLEQVCEAFIRYKVVDGIAEQFQNYLTFV